MNAPRLEDKPLKYPPIFNTADVAVIAKIDLAPAVEFDQEAAHRSHTVPPPWPADHRSFCSAFNLIRPLMATAQGTPTAERWASDSIASSGEQR